MAKSILISLLLVLTLVTAAHAHPGSGIVVDSKGNIYFTDTGKGVWKVDKSGQLTFIESQRFHWMAIDESGCFTATPRTQGGDFELIKVPGSDVTLILSSDFPITMHKNGNIYIANTRHGITSIIRKSPDGSEKVLVKNEKLEYVDGIVSTADGSIYATVGNKAANVTNVMKITLDGKMTSVASYTGNVEGRNLPLETTPSYCRGIDLDAAGNIYIAATGSRQVVKISPERKVGVILENNDGWSPTSVAFYQDKVYVLEWHDVPEAQLEEREVWIPRVRRIGSDGKITLLAQVSRE